MAVNSITFGGVNSADFGIYISGEGVFNAPKRDVEMIAIPGRDGELALDKGRFENIEVTYPAFNFEPNDYETFAKNLSDFRNAICSLRGYQRLTDTFHPDEYRMAAYIGGLEIKPIKYNTASEFSIIFDCKPQRYLTDGETPITLGEWGETETVSGDIVEIENDGIEAVKSLSVELEPIQSGSGTPSPDNIRPISGRTECVAERTGKNVIPYPYKDSSITRRGVTWTVSADGTLSAHGTATATNFFALLGQNSTDTSVLTPLSDIGLKAGDTLTLSSNYAKFITVQCNRADGSLVSSGLSLTGGGSVTATIPSTAVYVYIGLRVLNGETIDQDNIFVQLERGSAATDYEPYQGTTYTTALGRTVYGGTLDVVSGVLTVDRACVTFDGSESWGSTSGFVNRFRATVSANASNANQISNYLTKTDWGVTPYTFSVRDTYLYVSLDTNASQITVDEFKAYLSAQPLQVVYELATPQTYQLTGQDVELIEGTNYIWSDSGEISVEALAEVDPWLYKVALETKGFRNIEEYQ